jgi:hypothetical protein
VRPEISNILGHVTAVVVADAVPYHVVAHFRCLCSGSPPLPTAAARSPEVETKSSSNQSTPLATRRSGQMVAAARDSRGAGSCGEAWEEEERGEGRGGLGF